MSETDHNTILRNVGRALIAVGVIDIAIMIYCIINRTAYSSSFNIFAVVGGFFLVRGSLRAATVVRWFSVFLLAGFLALPFAWPFIQPTGLTFTQFRLNPIGSLASIVIGILLLAVLFWVARQLSQNSVQEAQAIAGRKLGSLYIPVAAGIGTVLALVVFLNMFRGGETAARAKSMAEQTLGQNYRYHVSSLNIQKNNRGTFVNGMVVAWNETEIKNFPVQWSE